MAGLKKTWRNDMTVATIENNQLTPFIEQYEKARATFPGENSDLAPFRKQAIAQFVQTGFPTMAHEDWRFTQLKPMLNKAYTLQLADSSHEQISLDDFAIKGLDSYQLVIVDGAVDKKASSLPQTNGVKISAISDMAENQPNQLHDLLSRFETPVENGFVALNNASVSQGFVIHVEAGVKLDKPLELIIAGGAENVWSQPRIMVTLDKGAELELIERHVSYSDARYVTNQVNEIELADDAKLDWCVLQQQNKQQYHVGTMFIKQHANSEISTHTVSLGGALIRNQLTVNQLGEHAHCQLNGVYAIAGKQLVDNFTRIIHSSANGSSDELYKGVLDNRSHAIFHGRIKVAQDAQHIDSEQANHTLLLSRDAQIDTKPQLEIYADDVKCAHGATVGELDKTSLFYLQSRGLSEAQARALLTYGFVNEVIERMQNETVSEYIAQQLQQQLLVEV